MATVERAVFSEPSRFKRRACPCSPRCYSRRARSPTVCRRRAASASWHRAEPTFTRWWGRLSGCLGAASQAPRHWRDRPSRTVARGGFGGPPAFFVKHPDRTPRGPRRESLIKIMVAHMRCRELCHSAGGPNRNGRRSAPL